MQFMKQISILLLAAGLMGFPVFSCAQTTPTTAAKVAPEIVKPTIKTLPPAYNDKMLRLAEVLGSLHYLRELCGAKEGMLWRDQMENVLAKEEPTPKRKADLISRFNRGHRTFQEIYRSCTPLAVEAVNSYLREGGLVSASIASRYGR